MPGKVVNAEDRVSEQFYQDDRYLAKEVALVDGGVHSGRVGGCCGRESSSMLSGVRDVVSQFPAVRERLLSRLPRDVLSP